MYVTHVLGTINVIASACIACRLFFVRLITLVTKQVRQSRKWQSRTQRSSHKTGHFWPFGSNSVQKSTQHRVVYTKSVRESEQTSYISSQSSKRLFRKYRFSNLHILHFRCFISCLGLKIIAALCCIYEKC